MSNSVKERVKTDLQKAKEEGQLRGDRVRDILKDAVSQAAAEVKEGSREIRLVVKDAIAAVIENFQEKSSEAKEEIQASIEGAIEGISLAKRDKINQAQAELKQLQNTIEVDAEELQEEIDGALVEIEQTSQESSPPVKEAIQSAIGTIKDSEEAEYMKKRYGQLQAQLEILQANLKSRYGHRYDEVKKHLDDAKAWYDKTKPKAEEMAETTKQKHAKFEEKLGSAGTAAARKEQQVKQVLRELWHSATDVFQADSESSTKEETLKK